MTLRWRLTLAFVTVVLFPLLVGTVLVARAFPHAIADRQAASAASSARLVSQVLRDHCDRARAAAEAAGRAATTGRPADASAVVVSLVQRGMADGVRVTGPGGRLVAQAGVVPQGAADCSAGRARGAHVTAVVPLLTARGSSVGTAVASFDLEGALLAGLRGDLGNADLVLLSQDGSVVVGRGAAPADVVRTAVRRPDGAISAAWVAAGQQAGPGQPFAVVIAQRSGRSQGLLLDAALVVAVALLVAVAIAVLSARATTRPLEVLNDAAGRVAAGDLAVTIDVRSRDELGRLATTFNAMTQDLRTYVGQLRASRDEMQQALRRLGETLAGSHDLDRILQVVVESAVTSTRAAGGMVLLLNPARDALVLAASHGMDVSLDLTLPVGEGISGSVAATGEPLRGRAGQGPGELWPAKGEPSGSSCIAVPLKTGGTVVGVLDLFGSALPGGFDDDDLATIRTFASQATVAVDNVMLHEEAQRLSITDALTGLWNYRYFTMTMSKEIERAERFGRPLSLLILDLDRFKSVNDTYGHQRGDAVLIELASRIRAEARDVDTVCRYGGEELVVVLPETDEAGAKQAAERFCAAVRRKEFGATGVAPLRVTVSAGVAVFPQHATTASGLLAAADRALYVAKDSGRDTWRLAGSDAG